MLPFIVCLKSLSEALSSNKPTKINSPLLRVPILLDKTDHALGWDDYPCIVSGFFILFSREDIYSCDGVVRSRSLQFYYILTVI
jgi:hypothetical protein